METFGLAAGCRRRGRRTGRSTRPRARDRRAHTEGSGVISYGVNQKMGWGGGFYWAGGGAQAYPGEIGFSSPPCSPSYFGWQIICGWSTCDGTTKPGEISILGLELEAGRIIWPHRHSRRRQPRNRQRLGPGVVARVIHRRRTDRRVRALGEPRRSERLPDRHGTAEPDDLAPMRRRLILTVVQHRIGQLGRRSAARYVGARRGI